MSSRERGERPPPSEVHGLSELVNRMVVGAHERFPRLHRPLLGVVALLGAVCCVAVVARFSLLPLLPLPLLAVAGFAITRMRPNLPHRRKLLFWSAVVLATTSVAFWLMATIGRYYHAE